MDLLSEDQNGSIAPSVPGKRRALVASSGRTHNPTLPFTTPVNATVWPSDDTAKPGPPSLPPLVVRPPSGGLISKRITGSSALPWRKCEIVQPLSTTSRIIAATVVIQAVRFGLSTIRTAGCSFAHVKAALRSRAV